MVHWKLSIVGQPDNKRVRDCFFGPIFNRQSEGGGVNSITLFSILSCWPHLFVLCFWISLTPDDFKASALARIAFINAYINVSSFNYFRRESSWKCSIFAATVYWSTKTYSNEEPGVKRDNFSKIIKSSPIQLKKPNRLSDRKFQWNPIQDMAILVVRGRSTSYDWKMLLLAGMSFHTYQRLGDRCCFIGDKYLNPKTRPCRLEFADYRMDSIFLGPNTVALPNLFIKES